MNIDSHEPVETFCLFFRHGIAEDVRRVSEFGSRWLLDNPVLEASDDAEPTIGIARSAAASSEASVQFFETLQLAKN